MFDFVCIALAARSRIAFRLAASGRSCRNMKQDLECEGEAMSVLRGLLSRMEEGSEVQTT